MARNRTITLSENEINQYKKLLYKSNDLKSNYKDNIIINDDLFNCLDNIPNNHFDLIIIDPPYNLDKSFNDMHFKSMSSNDYEGYLRSWFYKVCDKLKSSGSLYMCGDWKSTSSMQEVIEERLTILNRITWQREKGRGCKSNWKNGLEDIWYAVKNPHDYYFNVDAVKIKRKVLAPYKENGLPKDWEETEEGNYRLTYPSNFWDDITIPFWSMPENTNHPTQKSEKLYAKLILSSSKENDIIFDPFLGSGTSAVVAAKLNRKYVGIEINQEYACYALKRLDNAKTNKSIQGYINGVFYERNSNPNKSQ